MDNKTYFKFIFLVVGFVCALNCEAQSWNTIVSMKDVYICGEGRGGTIEEADKAALNDLISQISVIVEGESSLMTVEEMFNTSGNVHETYLSTIKTYSDATVTNTTKIILHKAPKARVGRYMKRSDLNIIFEGRRAKVHEYLRLAQVAEQKKKLDDALRYYYWALSLLKSLQFPSSEKWTDREGETHVLLSWIPFRIDEIMDDVQVRMESKNDHMVTLFFTYQDQPVTSIDYTYFDGQDWSNIYSAKDGRGLLELRKGTISESAQIKIEYAFVGQSHLDKELESVLSLLRSNPIKSSYKTVSLVQSSLEDEQLITSARHTMDSTTSAVAVLTTDPKTKQLAIVDAFIESIRQNNPKKVEKYLTKEAADMYHKLINYGTIQILDCDDFTFSKYCDETLVRSIPMAFSFSRGVRKNFVEDIVLSINKHNKIDNIAFGLEKDAMNTIMSKTYWSDTVRQTLVTFLENYKTAFAFKQLKYLESIFSNDAIIIVGHVVKKKETVGDGQQVINQYITRTQYTKEKYMQNLARCFDQQEFVNIRFGNVDVVKAGIGGELYGIQIKQDYYSSTYGDQGYLYLQVDFNNDLPLIRIRTWQETPDPELMKLHPSSNGIIGMGQF